MRRLTDFLLIKEGERSHVLYFLSIFLLLGAGLALGRGTADALFFKRYGIEHLPLMYALVSPLLALTSLSYAAYADRLASERFFSLLLGVLACFVTGSWLLMSFTHIESAYPVYFLVYEVSSEILLVHAALYLAQNFEILQSKRLTPLIFAGVQVGKVAGGLLLALAAPVIGIHDLLLVWVVLVVGLLGLIRFRHRRLGISPYYHPARKKRGALRQSLEQISQGLKFTKQSDLLRAASFALFFMVVAFYILNYSVNLIYTKTFPTEASLGAFFGVLTAVTSVFSLLLQVFITNKLLHRYGVRAANMVFPMTGLMSFIALLVSFALPAALIGSVHKDVVMPAVRNPTRNLFFSVLPDYIQGRARALGVALVLPIALALTGGLLVGLQGLQNRNLFLVGGIMASLFYLYFNIRMNKAYMSTILATLKEKLFLPSDQLQAVVQAGGEEVLNELRRGVCHSDGSISYAYAKIVVERFPEQAPNIILGQLECSDEVTRDKLVKLLASFKPQALETYLWRALATGDDHNKATALNVLFDSQDRKAESLVPQYLLSENPRLRAMAVYGVMQYDLDGLQKEAFGIWRQMLEAESVRENLAGLDLLARKSEPRFQAQLLGLLGNPNVRVQTLALVALEHWSGPSLRGLGDALRELYAEPNPDIRLACVCCCRMLPVDERRSFALTALEDEHAHVRTAGIEILIDEGEDIIDWLFELAMQNRGSPRAQQAMLMVLTKLRAKADLFREFAESKTKDAYKLFCVSQAMQNVLTVEQKQTPTYALIDMVLDERVQQVTDLALMAMENFENKGAIAVIRAGLNSGDRRHIANAGEALLQISSKKLAAKLGELLIGEDGRPKRREEEEDYKTFQDVLNWCSQYPDHWLRRCGQHALRMTNMGAGHV
jgi:hypothetical protein